MAKRLLSESGITQAKAIELLRLHNPNLVFQGFADTSTATPTHTVNNAWIISESGTVLGTADCVQGQVIYSNGSAFVVEDMQQKTNVEDELFNYNLNTNYRWESGVEDTGEKFSAFFSSNIPSIEEENSVFDYTGRCAKGCTIQTRVLLGNFTADDLESIFNTVRIALEVYIPNSTSVRFRGYVYNNTEIAVGSSQTFSSEGVHLFELDLDITSYTSLTGIRVYALSGSGDLENVRFGRFYVGTAKQGSLDGIDKEINHRIVNNNETFGDSYFDENRFIIGTRDRYNKPEQLQNNEAAVIYEILDELTFGRNTTTDGQVVKEIYDFPDDFPLPFKQAVRMYTPSALTTSSRSLFSFPIRYRKRMVVSAWVEFYTTSTTNGTGYVLRYLKGYNDLLVKEILVKVPGNTYDDIVADIDTNGFWESVETGYTLTSYGYLEWEGKKLMHLACEITADVDDSDFCDVNFGSNYGYISSGNTFDLLCFGFQIFDSELLSQTNSDAPFRGIGEKAIFDHRNDNQFEESYNYDNVIVDKFNGGGVTVNTSGDATINHSGIFEILEPLTLTFYDDAKFGKRFQLYNDGSSLPKYVSTSERNTLIRFVPDVYISEQEYLDLTVGFWLDRREINGNTIMYMGTVGSQWFITSAQLACKGFVESRVASTDDDSEPLWEVTEVDGYYSYVKFYMQYNNESNNDFRLVLNDTTGNGGDVTELNIYNPTCIYHQNINPYHIYQSKAEKFNSEWIGKKLLYIGDSQYNDGVMGIKLAQQYGFKVIDAHYGGHMMKILGANRSVENYSSFYHEDLRNAVLAIDDVDIYIFTCSTNDGSGGGDSSTLAVQDVLDNYPVYGDDSATVIAKQALFDAMTDTNVDDMFGYKSTYSAYLKQVQTNHPNARIILTSVPISCSGKLTGVEDVDGNGIWDSSWGVDSAREDVFLNIATKADDSLEVSNKHMTNYVDLLNKVGLTFENFTTFCIDGTHWKSEIKERIAQAVIAEIERIV